MNTKTPVTFGNARFTVYSSGCVRLEYAREGRFSPYPSVLTGPVSASPIAVEVRRQGKRLQLRTPVITLTYRDDGENFSPANLQITHPDAQGKPTHWMPGKQDAGNLGTVVRSLDFWKWCGGPERFPVEGLLSTDGAHLIEDNPRVYWNARDGWIENRARMVGFDGYFFAYGNQYKTALQDFVRVFGPIPMVPRWTFGFWYSRWHAYTGEELLQLAKRYQRERIPLDVMIIDTDWRGGWGGYDWNKKYFPNPEKTLRALHDMGLQTSLNDHPGYGYAEPLPETDSHVPGVEQALGARPHAGEWACDWSNERAVDHWRDKILGPFFDQGMDFWWIDGWIKTPAQTMDSQLWANHHYYELARQKTGKRGMILSRWGGIGSHRYPVQFSGDTPSDWATLQNQIEVTARGGNLGAAYWSHDIGGFFGRKLDEELYIRWFQFGSLSPVFRTHSDHGIREPWKYSARCKRLFRKQAQMRYALAPLFYNLAREAHLTGCPLVRPLFLEYNDNDGGARDRKFQYCLGRDLLVIPADGPADARTGVFRKRAYFPDGIWWGLEMADCKHGLFDGDITIPLDQIAVYVRQGAIIPHQVPPQSIGTATPATMHFDYYPDPHHSSTLELYEDDGESLACAQGAFAITKINARRTARALEWTAQAPRGRYDGQPTKRTWVVRFRLEPTDQLAQATVRVGRGNTQPLPVKEVTKCLAGTIQSPWRFAEVQVPHANEAVRIKLPFALSPSFLFASISPLKMGLCFKRHYKVVRRLPPS